MSASDNLIAGRAAIRGRAVGGFTRWYVGDEIGRGNRSYISRTYVKGFNIAQLIRGGILKRLTTQMKRGKHMVYYTLAFKLLAQAIKLRAEKVRCPFGCEGCLNITG